MRRHRHDVVRAGSWCARADAERRATVAATRAWFTRRIRDAAAGTGLHATDLVSEVIANRATQMASRAYGPGTQVEAEPITDEDRDLCRLRFRIVSPPRMVSFTIIRDDPGPE